MNVDNWRVEVGDGWELSQDPEIEWRPRGDVQVSLALRALEEGSYTFIDLRLFDADDRLVFEDRYSLIFPGTFEVNGHTYKGDPHYIQRPNGGLVLTCIWDVPQQSIEAAA